MAAIGREGGHSRGARARAASGGNTDVAQGAGSQPFVGQANEERSSFESGRGSQSSGYGSKEHSGTSRNERERSDNSNEGNSFSRRERM
jgi:hypothetical protein